MFGGMLCLQILRLITGRVDEQAEGALALRSFSLWRGVRSVRVHLTPLDAAGALALLALPGGHEGGGAGGQGEDAQELGHD